MELNEMDIFKFMSIKEVSEKYGIPYRTVQNWKEGCRKSPSYIISMINRIQELEEENSSLRIDIDFWKYKAQKKN